MRVAAVDIGTNTVLLLVAEMTASGRLQPVLERATITRLGEGVDRTGELAPAAVQRTLTCLDEYARLVRETSVARAAVVGTSAMRDARGGEPIVERVRAEFGVEPRVITGNVEAQLTFFGGASGLDVGAQEPIAVFDIGGGSTEVILGSGPPGGVIAYAESFDIGSVRLTERHVAHDPPTASELSAIEAVAKETLASVPAYTGARAPIGIAGTMTTLGAVALGVVPYDGARLHGRQISCDRLRGVVRHLAAMNLEARRRVPGIEPKRADVLVAGGIIALAILDHWRAPSVLISDRGVRWGLAEELARAAPAP